MCIYISHIFFICSSIGEHLGCFHILAIVNNAAMNIGVHISFQISIFVSLDEYPEVEFLGHMVDLFLTFGGMSAMFSIVATSIYNPTNSERGLSLVHILTNTCYLLSFL